MGKKRVAVIGEEKKEIHIPGMKGGARLAIVEAEIPTEEKPITTETQEIAKTKKTKPAKKRGKNYLAAKTKIDPTRLYLLDEAIKLAKETSIGKFNGSLEIHLVTSRTGLNGEVALPYFQGKTRKVEIASQETIDKIESGKIDFDILVSTSAFMPNLVKYAKILGPKGLMPNPKSQTIVDDPEKAAKLLQKESFSYRTEANAPLIHTIIGKISQKDEELEANLKTLISAVGSGNIKKAVICASMGPAVKLDLTSF